MTSSAKYPTPRPITATRPARQTAAAAGLELRGGGWGESLLGSGVWHLSGPVRHFRGGGGGVGGRASPRS